MTTQQDWIMLGLLLAIAACLFMIAATVGDREPRNTENPEDRT